MQSLYGEQHMSIREQTPTIEAVPTPDPHPQPPAKRQKRSQRPPEFWDNLSRVPLCRDALREFDRRTVRPTTHKPPVWSVLKEDLVKQLKRLLGTVVRTFVISEEWVTSMPWRIMLIIPFPVPGTGNRSCFQDSFSPKPRSIQLVRYDVDNILGKRSWLSPSAY